MGLADAPPRVPPYDALIPDKPETYRPMPEWGRRGAMERIRARLGVPYHMPRRISIDSRWKRIFSSTIRSTLLSRLATWARADLPEPDPQALLEIVVDALRLAALPADRQVDALPDFVHVPDEVALLYDDAWEFVPQIREAALVTDEQYEMLSRLDRHYEEMSNARDKEWLWTIKAMQTDDRWATSRQLADEALKALGRAPGPPRFPGVTWVPGGEQVSPTPSTKPTLLPTRPSLS